jgi:hypothetical protein
MSRQPLGLSEAKACEVRRKVDGILEAMELGLADLMADQATRREVYQAVRCWADRGLDREWPMHPGTLTVVAVDDEGALVELAAIGTDPGVGDGGE